MRWAGKAIGTTVGAVFGGPVGAGVGAVVGHLLADREPKVRVTGLVYDAHGFSPQGAGLRVVPEWEAAGLAGEEVRVRAVFGGRRWEEVVEIEAAQEFCKLPEWVLPWAELEDLPAEGGREALRIEVRAPGEDPVSTSFPVEVPGRLRRLSGGGPGREALALAAAARVGGRTLSTADVRRIRGWMEEAHRLDEVGVGWLRLLLIEAKEIDPARLTAEKMAERAGLRLEIWEQERLLCWLCEGVERGWAEARGWVEAFSHDLGLEPPWSDRAPLPQSREHAARLLGVGLRDDPEAQRQAWRKLLQRYHPDRSREDPAYATQKTAQLNAAWELLRGSA